MYQMNFYNLNETVEKIGLGRCSIYRYYESNPELWHETKIESKRRLIPESHLKLLCKKNIYTRASEIEEHNINLKRLIDTLAIGSNSVQYKCFRWHWDWAGCIEFSEDMSDTYKILHSYLPIFLLTWMLPLTGDTLWKMEYIDRMVSFIFLDPVLLKGILAQPI
jgi:hypothetical protein